VINKNMLASFMKKYGETQRDLANSLGISLSRLNAKINNWNGADFTQAEVEFIMNRYRMSKKEGSSVFLH
jgi:hypothetical protein